MTAAYAAAVETNPDKSRFMFAYTNKDVAALNEQARELHKARGDLGDDVMMSTKYGPQAYATGDRVQFTGNAWTQEGRESGLVNGRVGTVEALTYDDQNRLRMTVALDNGGEAQSVSFVVGPNARAGEFDAFKRGYAGTIYKGQGATLDESFVLADDKWRDSSAYVALSRHRESVQMFASKECFDDLADMTRSFARSDGKDAAISYVIDDAVLFEIGAEVAVEEGAAQTAQTEAATGVDAADARTDLAAAGEIPEGKTVAASLDTGIDLPGIGAAAKVLDGLVSALTGAPEKPVMTAKQKREGRLKAFRARQDEQRKAEIDALKRELGRDLTEEEVRELSQTRDRGGGQSL
jgi:ribosomal protein L21E